MVGLTNIITHTAHTIILTEHIIDHIIQEHIILIILINIVITQNQERIRSQNLRIINQTIQLLINHQLTEQQVLVQKLDHELLINQHIQNQLLHKEVVIQIKEHERKHSIVHSNQVLGQHIQNQNLHHQEVLINVRSSHNAQDHLHQDTSDNC